MEGIFYPQGSYPRLFALDPDSYFVRGLVMTVDIDTKIGSVLDSFQIELPSWGFANTGTRFGKFIQSGAANTDLPPGTSPLSKLDLGPFEVHSMV